MSDLWSTPTTNPTTNCSLRCLFALPNSLPPPTPNNNKNNNQQHQQHQQQRQQPKTPTTTTNNTTTTTTQALIKRRADPNARALQGPPMTALDIAVSTQSPAFAREMEKQGCKFHLKSWQDASMSCCVVAVVSIVLSSVTCSSQWSERL